MRFFWLLRLRLQLHLRRLPSQINYSSTPSTGTLMDGTWGMGTRTVVNDGSTHYFLSALKCKSQN